MVQTREETPRRRCWTRRLCRAAHDVAQVERNLTRMSRICSARDVTKFAWLAIAAAERRSSRRTYRPS